MSAHITRLEPAFHAKIWGSTELEPWFPRPLELIGEVWFPPPTDVPILVKFLFTSARLSVQVHPDDEYARRNENSPGKTEMWHIMRAGPRAEIALGFRETITRALLREASISGEIEQLLRWIPVHAGETYFTPAGTVHAIGPDLALCEIQQVSDVTYRLYDYGRPRPLHLDRAAEVSQLVPHPGMCAPEPAGDGYEVLVRCPYFVTESLHFAQSTDYHAYCAHLLICLEGSGAFDGAPFALGEVWHVPASAAFVMQPHAPVHFLRTSIPAPAGR